MNWITDYFNRWAAQKAEEKLIKVQREMLVAAIKHQDVDLINNICSQISDRTKFVSFWTYETEMTFDSMLLEKAIATDNLDVFDSVTEVVFQGKFDPNFIIVQDDQEFGGWRTPILCRAIERNAKNIALKIAKMPETYIDAQARLDLIFVHSSDVHEVSPKPIDLARANPNMKEVLAVLAQRYLNRLEKEAAGVPEISSP